mmetsp:Transcript_9625/g.13632  ORF Transcript_9625/g.13632 Transcript_9625/m.13632 type:complete len:969 (+) Transcript_9625:1-2907(+)
MGCNIKKCAERKLKRPSLAELKRERRKIMRNCMIKNTFECAKCLLSVVSMISILLCFRMDIRGENHCTSMLCSVSNQPKIGDSFGTLQRQNLWDLPSYFLSPKQVSSSSLLSMFMVDAAKGSKSHEKRDRKHELDVFAVDGDDEIWNSFKDLMKQEQKNIAAKKDKSPTCSGPASSPSSLPCTNASDNIHDNSTQNGVNPIDSDNEANKKENSGQQRMGVSRGMSWDSGGQCLDLNPHCENWALKGECDKYASYQYMNDNCPFSCNRCNPQISIIHAKKPLWQDEIKFRYYSVPQIRSFVDSPLTHPIDWGLYGGSFPKPKLHTQTQSQSEDTSSEFTQKGRNCGNGNEGSGAEGCQQDAEHSYKTTFMDFDSLDQKTHISTRTGKYIDHRVNQIIGSTTEYMRRFGEAYMKYNRDYKDYVYSKKCINRHPLCAIWATRGFCELKPNAMREICSPTCHSCGTPFPQFSSPYLRYDLMGFVEAIEENRVVVSMNYDGDTGTGTGTIGAGSWEQESFDNNMMDDDLLNVSTSSKHDNQEAETVQTDTQKVKEQDMQQRNIPHHREDTTYILPLGILDSTVFKLKPGTPSARRALKARQRKPILNPDGTLVPVSILSSEWDMPFIIVMNKFLTDSECDALLETISYGIGVDMSDGIPDGEDGFPTSDIKVVASKQGDPVLTRSSSRAHVYPIFDSMIDEDDEILNYHPHNDGGYHNHLGHDHGKDNDDNDNSGPQFSPAINVLLAKMRIITGVAVESHVETPIVFDKFTAGDFQLATSHFEQAMEMENVQVGINKEPNSNSDNAKGGQRKDGDDDDDDDYDDGTTLYPKYMDNARTMCLTAFLNTPEDGGELIFPNMSNITVSAMKGRAVLYPAVLSLIGEELLQVHPLDREETVTKETYTVSDNYLIEDLSTIMGHNVVKVGTKYSVTICLRRYPNDEEGSGDFEENVFDYNSMDKGERANHDFIVKDLF